MAAILADDNFKCIFFLISLKFVPRSPIDNKPALIQVMAWREEATSHYLNQCWPSSLTHTCGSRGRWVKKKKKSQTTTHITMINWGLDKTTAILQTTFSNAFCWNKKHLYFDLNIPEVCFWRFRKQMVSTASGHGLSLNRWQAITWIKDDPIPWRIYKSPGLSKFAAREGFSLNIYKPESIY